MTTRTVILHDRFHMDWRIAARRARLREWLAALPMPASWRATGQAEALISRVENAWQAIDTAVASTTVEARERIDVFRFADTLLFMKERDSGVIHFWQTAEPGASDTPLTVPAMGLDLPFSAWWPIVRDRFGGPFAPASRGQAFSWFQRALDLVAKRSYAPERIAAFVKRHAGIDTDVARLAIACDLRPEGRTVLDPQHYNRVWKHRRGLKELQSKSPRLVKVAIFLLDSGHRPDGELDAGWVRACCHEVGITPSRWRKLIHQSSRPFWKTCETSSEPGEEIGLFGLRSWLFLLEGCLGDHALASQLWMAMFPHASELFILGFRLGGTEAFLRTVAKQARLAQADHRLGAFLEKILPTVQYWAMYAPDVICWKGSKGWRTWRREAEDGTRRLKSQAALRGAHWIAPSPLSEFTLGGWHAHWLSTPERITDAAIELRNCADGLLVKESLLNLLFFYVRSEDSDDTGMIALAETGSNYSIYEVRKRWNALPCARLQAFAVALLDAVRQEASRSNPTVITKRRSPHSTITGREKS